MTCDTLTHVASKNNFMSEWFTYRTWYIRLKVESRLLASAWKNTKGKQDVKTCLFSQELGKYIFCVYYFLSPPQPPDPIYPSREKNAHFWPICFHVYFFLFKHERKQKTGWNDNILFAPQNIIVFWYCHW